MKSQVTQDFMSCFARLPARIQEQARAAYRVWQKNTSHPGLQFKHIQGFEDLYSVRVGRGWRALGMIDGDTITWFWIGSHADYDKLID